MGIPFNKEYDHSRKPMRTIAVLLIITARGLLAQPTPQAFGIASIKAGNPQSRQLRSVISHGQLHAENVDLQTLIEDAYEIEPFQIAGGPPWLASDKFEVIAKGEAAASNAQVRLMLQTLLAERFRLEVHREKRESAIYSLVVKGQPKLQPAKEPGKTYVDIGSGADGNHYVFKSTSMARFAVILSRQLQRVVRDETHLNGDFDFELDATRDESNSNPFAAAIAPAVRQLGLELKSRRGPVEILIIDHAEKPSAN